MSIASRVSRITATQRRRRRAAGAPTIDANWQGPSATADGGAWTAEGVTAFSFTDPTFNNGEVNAIVDDGSGGKFVGGSFTSVTCNVTSTTYTTGYQRLIHLLPTGEVDAAWSCPAGNTVNALALDPALDRLYVGGAFNTTTLLGGEARGALGAVTASTGVVVNDWVCDANAQVRALALDPANDRLYVGGQFSLTLGGESRARLGAVTASTGVVVSGWVCDTSGSLVGLYALALDPTNDRLYVGGIFDTIGGESRDRLAAVTASTGVVVSGWVCNTNERPFALVLDTANDRLYVGGRLTTIGGESRSRLAAVTASTGVVVSGWVCSATGGTFPDVRALALDPANDRLYVGGLFSSSLGGESRARLGAVTASTGVVVSGWICNAGNNSVLALALDTTNDALSVGGDFDGALGLDGEQRDRYGTVVASTGDLHVP